MWFEGMVPEANDWLVYNGWVKNSGVWRWGYGMEEGYEME
jgi:hypothetical protein